MEVVVSYWPAKKWFWIRAKTLQPKEPGDSPDDPQTYQYNMIWDGRDKAWVEQRAERRKLGGRLRPLRGIKSSEWTIEADEGEELDIQSEARQCAVVAIFEDTEDLL